MADAQDGQAKGSPTTIWQELDTWAKDFKPWQRFVLANAVRQGQLTDVQIDQAYSLFLHNNDLGGPPAPPIEIPAEITGRPTSAAPDPIRLANVGDLRAVNALPPETKITFSPSLTVVYGGNGVGKSGITRILSNACFSRKQPPILPNIYDEDCKDALAATIVITDGAQKEIPFAFDGITEHAELKRVAVFDTAVARTHLVDQSPLGFNPTGFDVFPEMVRVYDQITARLMADIERRSKENTFVSSFVAPISPVSKFVAMLSADTDLNELRGQAVFGETETARFEEVQRQIKDLQSKTAVETIKQLEGAKHDIEVLRKRLAESGGLLTDEKRTEYRAKLAAFVGKAREVTERGAESFKQEFFKGIGASAWEDFLAAAQALAQEEHDAYPHDNDHCLLCHRPLDAASAALIRRYWGFLASEARREAEEASANLDKSVQTLKAIRLDFFSAGTTAHAHLVRLAPDLAKQIGALVAAMDSDRTAIVAVLESADGEIKPAALVDVIVSLTTLTEQIDADVARLKELKTDDAIKALETERITLRHRQVLAQLLPEMETFVSDLVWVKNASGAPRRSLTPRPITSKESELFTTIIAQDYRDKFEHECTELDCDLPVEFTTQGQRGQTVRSLSIKGGYSPDEILSEGEQRAVALADFLTEVALNPANAGIVLDDPVTSQDHQRKENIARRLVGEARNRQVIIFTHDLVFLTMLAGAADEKSIEILTHWIERDGKGRPGQISLDDCPATTPQYRNTTKAKKSLGEVGSAAGSERVKLIQRGMGELRRTVEEIVPHFLLKQVVNRWSDRIIVTGLKNVNWDDVLIGDIITSYEELSAYIEGHTHTEEKAGAPPEPKHLEEMIARVDDLIKRSRPSRSK